MIRKETLQALRDCNRKGILYKGQIHRIYEFDVEGLNSIRLKKQDVKDSQLSFAAIKWPEIKKRRVETLPYSCRISEYDGEKIFVIQHIDNDNVFLDVIGEEKIIEEIKKLKEKKNAFLNKSDKELFEMHEEVSEMKRMWVNPNFFEGRITHENEEVSKFRTTIDDFEDIQYEIIDNEKSLQNVHNKAQKERRLEERYNFLQEKLKEHYEKVDFNLIRNWPKIKEQYKAESSILRTLEKASGRYLAKKISQVSSLYKIYDNEAQRWTPLYSYKEIWTLWRLIRIEEIEKTIKEIEEEKVWEWD